MLKGSREGAYREGAYREGACRKGAYRKGAYRKEDSISGKIAVVGAYQEGVCRKEAYYKEGSIGSRVGISGKAGIEASSKKNIFRSFRLPLLLYRALSIIYSGGVDK